MLKKGSSMKTKYAEAFSVAEGFKGRIYQYTDDGNHTEVVWTAPTAAPTKEAAIDDAVEWADEHGFEVEIDFS